MNVLVINNLASGTSDDSIFDFVRKYSADGDSVTIRTFDGHTPFTKLLEGAGDFDFVVAAGGDGTVSTVLYELRYSGIPVMPYPTGTGNLLALNLDMPFDNHTFVKMVDAGCTIDLDLGEVVTPQGTYGFGNMAGCGFDQKIMSDAVPNKKVLGEVAYVQAAFTNALAKPSNITLTIDGEKIETKGISVIFVNLDRLQFDITVSAKNSPVDGLMDVAVLKGNSPIELLPIVAAKMLDPSDGIAKRVGGIDIYRGREITIEADPAMMMEYNGEPTEVPTPFTVRCLPGAARIIVPAETKQRLLERNAALGR